MAAKRFRDASSSDNPDRSNEKRIKTRPSFASVIAEAVTVNSLQNFCLALEPMLRRVVTEEVENSLRRCSRTMSQSPSLRIKAPEPSPSTLQLIFRKNLSLPIFTGSKIVDVDGHSLEIQLVDTTNGVMIPVSLPHPVKVEIVVLDGDFPSDDQNHWTSKEFDSNILKERTGKRPLLAGDCLTVTLRDGLVGIGEIEFTDNSSWIRSRKFRLGARVVLGSSQGVCIREAVTDAFVVKDHRGELYKKHHPPSLKDEVWRLEKIGKDGAFHKKLAASNVHTVQDFLQLFVVDQPKLRRILGNGMSEKMWEVTIKHAMECKMGNKHYIFEEQNYSVTFTPICQAVSVIIDGQTYSTRDLPSIHRCYIENLARQAHANWSSLQEVNVFPNEIPLLTRGEQLVDQYTNEHQQAIVKSMQQIDLSGDRYIEIGNQTNITNPQMGYMNWRHLSPGMRYSVSDSSSDGGEISYFNGGS